MLKAGLLRTGVADCRSCVDCCKGDGIGESMLTVHRPEVLAMRVGGCHATDAVSRPSVPPRS